jgi:2'-hydroxyisoflavone reductase
MNVLVVGGTQFVGRTITEALLADGHTVTLFTRGRTNPDLFPDVARIIGDRNKPLSELESQADQFDACIDVSGYTLSQVERMLAAVGATVRRYLFISTVSVYQAPIHADFEEDAPVEVPEQPYAPLTPAVYGRLKVACEQVIRAKTGHRGTIFRLGLVNGPYDPTDRATSWAVRALQGGTMAVPAAPDTPLQVIDARDIAAAAVRALTHDIAGTFTLVQSPTTWSQWIETASSLAPELPSRSSQLLPHGPDPAQPLYIDDQSWIEEYAAKLTDGRQNGPLPMYLPREHGWEFWQASNRRARAAGFKFRPYSETIRDTLRWRLGIDERPLRAGLTAEQEEALIRAWDQRR